MAALECGKSDSKSKSKSIVLTENSQPSVGGQRSLVRVIKNDVNSNDRYQHVMSCIHGINETISLLVASVEPIVPAWNEHKSSDSIEARGSIDLISSCLTRFCACKLN